MTGRLIETSIDIKAGAHTVWQVLTDFGSYPDWNPFIRKIEGLPREGERLSVLIHPPGGSPMRFRPRVQSAQQPNVFSWLGSFLIPGLFDGRHEFTLEQTGVGTRFHHRENFSGILVPLAWNKLREPTSAGFEAMNRALKQRAESISKD